MPRSRARPKQSKTHVKVKVKTKRVSKAQPNFFTNSALSYDRTRTQFANYKSMGLQVDSNQIGAERKTIRGFKPRVKGPTVEPLPADQLHPLELEVGEALKTYKSVPPGERQILNKLIARHGDDLTAMARDTRLNQYQHTASHLRHRIEKMRAEDEEDANAAAAAAATEAPVPAPRHCKKITKIPNNAFKSRSTNFN